MLINYYQHKPELVEHCYRTIKHQQQYLREYNFYYPSDEVISSHNQASEHQVRESIERYKMKTSRTLEGIMFSTSSTIHSSLIHYIQDFGAINVGINYPNALNPHNPYILCNGTPGCISASIGTFSIDHKSMLLSAVNVGVVGFIVDDIVIFTQGVENTLLIVDMLQRKEMKSLSQEYVNQEDIKREDITQWDINWRGVEHVDHGSIKSEYITSQYAGTEDNSHLYMGEKNMIKKGMHSTNSIQKKLILKIDYMSNIDQLSTEMNNELRSFLPFKHYYNMNDLLNVIYEKLSLHDNIEFVNSKHDANIGHDYDLLLTTSRHPSFGMIASIPIGLNKFDLPINLQLIAKNDVSLLQVLEVAQLIENICLYDMWMRPSWSQLSYIRNELL